MLERFELIPVLAPVMRGFEPEEEWAVVPLPDDFPWGFADAGKGLQGLLDRPSRTVLVKKKDGSGGGLRTRAQRSPCGIALTPVPPRVACHSDARPVCLPFVCLQRWRASRASL